MTYYKFLGEDGYSTYQQTKWHLPTKTGKPGRVMPKAKGELIACENGYHLCREQDLIYWLGPVLYEAEAVGDELVEVNEGETKVVVRSARLLRRIETWNNLTARPFAADCAEHVLYLFERERPGDTRPRDAIAAARAFARGEIDGAAWAATRVAAGAAAWAAARAAGDAAWGAARVAAGDAAWAATRVAARDAAGAAAWAAGDAARDAGGAARVAARAAGDAAGDAARDAAGAAEREWQTARLLQYIRGEVE